MAGRYRLRWKYLWFVPGYVIGAYLNAAAQSSLDATMREAGLTLSLFAPLAMASVWFNAYKWTLLGWFIAGILALIISLAIRDDRRRGGLELSLRPAWELERQYQCLLVLRGLILHPEAPLEDIKTFGVVDVGKIRGELIDEQGKLFSPSVTSEFHRPTMLNVARADPFVVGLTHAAERRSAIAEIDHLLAAIHRQWRAITSSIKLLSRSSESASTSPPSRR